MYYEMIGFAQACAPALPKPDFDQPDNMALFLDFDGTLVDIAETPHGVDAKGIVDLLHALQRTLDQRVAIVTGRSLPGIKTHLSGYDGIIYGTHGAELSAGGQVKRLITPSPHIASLSRAARDFSALHPGLECEEKQYGFVLHYRQAPELEGTVRQFLEAAIALSDDLTLQQAKKALEVKAAGIGKGTAVTDAMARFRWNGFTPVMIGDDATDEDGMAAAEASGGYGIKVGDGATCARYRLAHPAAVKGCLGQLVQRLS